MPNPENPIERENRPKKKDFEEDENEKEKEY